MIHLNWKTTLATTLLVSGVLPVVGVADATLACHPSEDTSARTLDASELAALGLDGPAGIYYAKDYQIAGQTYVEVWREANDVHGLQRDSTWNCGRAPDELVARSCSGCSLML